MAVPISKTWLQLQNMSGGSTCKPVKDNILVLYPGINDSTVIDALTWCEQFRTAGMIRFLYPSIIRLMSGAQLKSLMLWILAKLQANLPVGWVRTAAMDAKLTDLIDCINAPTAGKKAALQTFASGLDIDYTDEKDLFMADFLKRAINLTVLGQQSVEDSSSLIANLLGGISRIKGVSLSVLEGQLLDRIELIIGIV